MTQELYRRLAWTGIRKNRRLYLPYLLTCAGMVMMTYLVSFLSSSEALLRMRGGDTMRACLNLGFFVITFFSAIFLFYTHSFLIRRRKKEFGLYNILGMGKRHIAVVLLWESLLSAAVSLAGGLLAGLLLSRLAEAGMCALLGGGADLGLQVSPDSLLRTCAVFLAIFVLILLDSLRQLRLTNAIGLLRSENAGERPPRANWFFALAGLLLLGTAYWMAVTIQDPVSALLLFFVAVLLVIAGTYLLFISGSVAFCRALQRNRRYYYRTSHFVSVSSMVFRMKRNGAGLASICILCTMVLVMISTTVCLYAGAEDGLRARYPRSINATVYAASPEALSGAWTAQARSLAEQVTDELGAERENVLDYRVLAFGGLVRGGRVVIDPDALQGVGESAAGLWQVYVMPVEDYNRLMGTQIALGPDEAMIAAAEDGAAPNGTIALGNGEPLTVVSTVSELPGSSLDTVQLFPVLYVFVSDLSAAGRSLIEAGGEEWMDCRWQYAFDLSCPEEEQSAVRDALQESLETLMGQGGEEVVGVGCRCFAEERVSFYSLYGSLLFLGILLGVVFVLAAVLIIYYKQVSEGYEDQSRFDIMQKVGMTKREIRSSINSQVLTVFFLPLIAAGVHLAFAFPMVQKLLLAFGLTNLGLLMLVTVACYLVFAAFYLAVYRATSRAYYSIVSDARAEG